MLFDWIGIRSGREGFSGLFSWCGAWVIQCRRRWGAQLSFRASEFIVQVVGLRSVLARSLCRCHVAHGFAQAVGNLLAILHAGGGGATSAASPEKSVAAAGAGNIR